MIFFKGARLFLGARGADGFFLGTRVENLFGVRDENSFRSAQRKFLQESATHTLTFRNASRIFC